MTIKNALYIGLLGLMATACDGSVDTPRGASLALQPCERGSVPPPVSGAECGNFSLPENPAASEGNKIDIHVMRWPAISAVPESDPLFVIAGGPGQSAVAVAEHLAPVFYNLRKNRDIVFVDQRGTGRSNPLHCDSDEDASLLEVVEIVQADNLERLQNCADSWRQVAAFYTTDHAVGDLEAVRQALGYGEINLWGASYGTRVVLRYMQRYPQSLRAVVMDGLAPVQIALPAYIGRDAERALQLVSEQCLALADCAEHYGDIVTKAEALAERLQQSPIVLSIPHPLTGENTELRLDRDKLAALVRFSLYDRLLVRLLPHTIAHAEAGDYQVLAALLIQLFNSEQLPQIAEAMHLTILCNEDALVPLDTESQKFLGVSFAAPVRDVCEFWPKAELPGDYFAPVVSDLPALLLSGARDPVTPPQWGEGVASQLSGATHLVAPGAHHGVTAEGCAAAVITGFIRDRVVDMEKAACLQDIQPLPPYLATVAKGSEHD